MTVIDKVFTALKNNAGNSMTTAEIVEAIGDGTTREQVNSALWRLRTERDLIKQVKTGIHKYLGPSERAVPNGVVAVNSDMPKLERTIAKAATVFEEPEPEENPEDGRYFTQVGFAENGDVILSRDTDARVYRATPL